MTAEAPRFLPHSAHWGAFPVAWDDPGAQSLGRHLMIASLPLEIVAQLTHAHAVLERNLGATLEAIHVFGSAVDGGLKPRSDIDLMVTVSAPLAASARSSLMRDLLSASGKPGTDDSRRPLEVTVVVRDEVVPWRYPPLRELQFGEWLREELQAGIIQAAILDHDLAILLTQVRQHSVRLVGPLAPDLFDAVPQADLSRSLLDTIAQWHKASDWHGDERNVVLALARIWFSAFTGGIASKDAAADWALARLPDEHRPVLENARAAYLGRAEDDLARRPDEMAAFVSFTRTMIKSIFAAGAHSP